MGLLVERKTERIEFDDGGWVDILVSFNTRDSLLIEEAQAKPVAEVALTLLNLIIVAWSDEAPVNLETVGELKPERTREILEKLDKIKPALDPKVSSLPSTKVSRAKGPRRMRTS